MRRLRHIFPLSVLLVFLGSAGANAQELDPPTPTCIQTQANGDVVINWDIPADPLAQFTGYEVHNSQNDFLVTDDVISVEGIYGTTTYTHVGATGFDNRNAYYFITLSNDGTPQVSDPSEVYNAIYLDVVPGPASDVLLNWTQPYANDALMTGNYELWIQEDAGPWQLLVAVGHDGTAETQSISYLLQTCEADLNFQVFYTGPTGCQFISNVDGGSFEDEESPSIPAIDVASVDLNTGEPVISWNQVPEPDTYGYIVYRCVSGIPVPLDTVYAQDIVTYTHVGEFIPPNTPQAYTVAAFDSCDFANVSPTEDFCHRAPYLETPDWGSCDLELDLNWAPYEGREVITYRIYVSIDGGAFNLLDEVTGDVLTYFHGGLTSNTQYEYYIEATFLGTASFAYSNKRLITIQVDQPPAFTYLASVSVVDEGEVGIRVHTDETSLLDHLYILERRRKNGLLYTDVGYETTSAVEFIEFTDTDLNTNELQYEYRVHVINDCGDTVRTTNQATTVLLRGLANDERLANTLQWEPYEVWDGPIEGYTVYRSQEKGVLGNVIDDLPGNAVVFEDDVTDELLTPGLFCYTIEAREEINTFGLSEVSLTNQVCLQMDPKIWVPNAMLAFGVNNEFKPVIGYADFLTYRMRIYSRWGDLLFNTTNISEGWDGTWRGELVPEGTYVYYIEVNDGRGKLHERTGPVHMLVSGLE